MKFYQLSPEGRRKILVEQGIKLDPIDQYTLSHLNRLSENVIGQLRFPLSIVQKVIVNGHAWSVPMATEEPSVVAAANHGSSLFAKNGGIIARSIRKGINGQIIMQVDDSFQLADFKSYIPQLISLANQKFASLVKHGGGVRKISANVEKNLLYLLVLVDPAEAMGANKTNSILEFLSQKMLTIKGIKSKLFAILSNYPSQMTTAHVALDVATIGGREVAERIELLSRIAQDDVYRAVTNNKGIMNGVDAVLTATGNDYRAVEAACGVLASQSGQYRSLSRWRLIDGKLQGKLTLPLALGVVGGSIDARQDIQQAYRLFGHKINSHELAEITATIGLANNLAAMLAISTTGIQTGHMKLQARNLVAALGANDKEKQDVLKAMTTKKIYTLEYAHQVLKRIRGKK